MPMGAQTLASKKSLDHKLLFTLTFLRLSRFPKALYISSNKLIDHSQLTHIDHAVDRWRAKHDHWPQNVGVKNSVYDDQATEKLPLSQLSFQNKISLSYD